jgi:hypothetical protein
MEDKEYEALLRKTLSPSPSERYRPEMDRRVPIGGSANTDKLALFWIAFFVIVIGAVWLLG